MLREFGLLEGGRIVKVKMRRNPRYLALKIESDRTFERKIFLNNVWRSLTKLYGEYGASKAGMALVEYEPEKGFAVLRCENEALTMVRAALAALTSIGETRVAVHVLAVSGTLRALRKKLSRGAEGLSESGGF